MFTMKQKIAAASCLILSTSNAALNLKFFKDPKEVSMKNGHAFETTARSCTASDIDKLKDEGYLKSQNGEDRCLFNYFNGMCDGKYVEIGAHDGIQLSNSYAFYKPTGLGWKGVNIELNPDNYEQLVMNRPNDIANVHAAVCSDTQPLHYVRASNRAVGGLWEFSSEAHRDHWWKGIKLEDTTPINCTPVQVILDQTVGTGKFFFDFISVDIEGAELSALLGIDFDRIGFGVIVVEKNARDDVNRAIKEFLRSKGYDDIDIQEDACGFRNFWFLNRDFDSIYSQL